MHGRLKTRPDFAFNARRTATGGQLAILLLLLIGMVAVFVFLPGAGRVFAILVQLGFLVVMAWRLAILRASRTRPPTMPLDEAPRRRYSVIVALYDEAEVLPQLVERLSRIDYPVDLLDGYLALEARDEATIAAARALDLPSWLQVLVVPPGQPSTKPRALNHALSRIKGDFVTIYDAEDDPDPLQLREAAARFAAEDETLACLQAPLRIRGRQGGKKPSPFLDRQFAAEYAALFEIVLPALARMGLPFPLGGTSNHFRVSALRAMGGWDAWNVTEDADLGFRVWRRGWRMGVLVRPTHETPPGPLFLWLPQRTRWLKGYMQTIMVHTRAFDGMGWRGWWAVLMTIGAALAAAAVHAFAVSWIMLAFLFAAMAQQPPQTPWTGVAILAGGAATAVLTTLVGARRAGVPYGWKDMLGAPVYWSLLTLAFGHAFIRLIFEPHRWDKTPHAPDLPANETSPETAALIADSGRTAA